MLKNYIKITFRNMLRNRLFTSINILGLSVSIACCLLLLLYVSDQLSYDKQHGDNVYRLTSLLTQKNGTELNTSTSSIPVAPAIRSEIPEIEAAGRITSSGIFNAKDLITVKGESFYVENGAVADSNIFKILNYDLIKGNIENPLPNGNSIVLEKVWAIKLFGDTEAIGKTLKLSTALGEDQFEVSAVYDKNSNRAHYNPPFFISTANTSWNNFFNRLSSRWVGNNLAFTYLKLTDGANPKIVEQKIDEVFLKYGAEEMKSLGVEKEMSLQEVSDIHTTEGFMIDSADVVDMTFLRVLIGIGFLILVLACVNYINLSTAQAGNRSLEVGVRKVMGVTSKELVAQFLGESFIIVFISLLLSILLAELTLPIFNQLVDQPVAFTGDNMGWVAAYMIGFLIITALIAGIYPAVYLASFKPTSVLKGRNRDKGGVVLLRKALVTFQFIISIVLISAILIISEQVSFIQNKNLGFEPTSKLVVTLTTEEAQGNYELLKQQFKGVSQVRQVAAADASPGMSIINDFLVYKKGQTMDDAIHIYNNDVDEDYIPTLDIRLTMGNNFSKLDIQDTTVTKVIINESARKKFGLSENEVIGQRLFAEFSGDKMEFEIVGVMEDINQFSLHKSIEPVMLSLNQSFFGSLIIETDLKDYQAAIASLSTVWSKVMPETPIEATALTDQLNNQYASDYKTFNLIKYFAIISVFISCMGLYALSMFVAERRFKEIGVRKALGANIKDIVLLVSKDLSMVVVIAFLISVPISMYGMNVWLESFAYKIAPQVSTYLLAGLASILIGWITISYQSIKAARTNPVDTLRRD